MELFVGAIKAGASPSRLLTSAAISAFDNVLRTGKVPSKNRRGGASYGADGKQRQIAKSFHLHRLNGDEKPAITTAIEWRCDVNYVYKVAKQHAPYAEMDALFSLAKNDTSKVYEVAKLLDGLLAEVADEFLDYIAQSTNSSGRAYHNSEK